MVVVMVVMWCPPLPSSLWWCWWGGSVNNKKEMRGGDIPCPPSTHHCPARRPYPSFPSTSPYPWSSPSPSPRWCWCGGGGGGGVGMWWWEWWWWWWLIERGSRLRLFKSRGQTRAKVTIDTLYLVSICGQMAQQLNVSSLLTCTGLIPTCAYFFWACAGMQYN